MSKHTAGPWVHDTRGYPYPDVRAAKDGRAIAITWGISANPPKSKEAYAQRTEIDRANAQLIALTPDLLEALEQAIQPLELYKAYGWPDRNNVIGKAKAAIAKARGEA